MKETPVIELGDDHPVPADTVTHAMPRVLSSLTNDHAPIPPEPVNAPLPADHVPTAVPSDHSHTAASSDHSHTAASSDHSHGSVPSDYSHGSVLSDQVRAPFLPDQVCALGTCVHRAARDSVHRTPWDSVHRTPWDSVPPDDAYVPNDPYLPEDLYGPEDPEDPAGPRFLSEQDQWDAELDELLGRNRYSRVDELEWQEWDGIDQDEAERTLLRLQAPAWVFLPPGGELATAVEDTRPQAMSPMALIELLKAGTRQAGWIEALKAEAIASFIRQRRAEHATSPRPTQYDTKGRPIDPERSWYAELALALGVTTETIARRAETALRLTSLLRATHSALKCGALTWGKALAISEATADLPDEAARAVEAHVLKRAASQTHKNMLESLRRQVAKHRAAKDADDHRAAVADRTCKIVPLANGMAGLWIVNTADKIQQIWVIIQALATLAKRGTTPPTETPPATATPTPTPTSTAPTSTTPTAPTPADTAPAGAKPAGTASADTASAGTAPTDAAGATPPNTGGTTPHQPPETPTDATPAAPPAPADTGPPPTPPPAHPGPGTPDETATTTPDDAAITTPGGGASNDAPTTEQHRTGQHRTDTTTTADPTATPAADPAPEPVKDTRTAEQRRADVTADLFEHILHNGLDWLGRRLPDQHRRRPHIEVVIPATTLLGLDDDPAELTGYGPIPADLARRIATNGTWRRLLTDPTNGTVLEASTTRHDPGTLVTETLLARHPVCAWPGCNRTSRDCDRDHTTPFAQTGRTSLAGLAPYCEYHHVIKDTPAWGWTTTSHPDGSITLTTPTGHRYTTVPPARGPITQRASTGTGNHAHSHGSGLGGNSPVSSYPAKSQDSRIGAASAQPSEPADDPPPY